VRHGSCQLEANAEQETCPVEDFPVILSNNILKPKICSFGLLLPFPRCNQSSCTHSRGVSNNLNMFEIVSVSLQYEEDQLTVAVDTTQGTTKA
jgi:hypothetical protein